MACKPCLPNTQRTLRELVQAVNKISAESTSYPGCFYRIVNGEAEWINPPMEYGIVYKTTRRYNKKPIHTVLFDVGALSSTGIKEFTHNLGAIYPLVITPCYYQSTVPMFAQEGKNPGVECFVDSQKIYFNCTGGTFSGGNLRIMIDFIYNG